jgi:type IV secretion system protein VirD4
MRNYAGHRLAPWLAHVMVSRQETARALLTPGEVMQLPPSEELVLIAGTPPIRAKKLRYFEDSSFTSRVLPPPLLMIGAYADRPVARADDWDGIVRDVDARLSATEGRDGEASSGGLEQARHPGLETDKPADPAPAIADPLGLGDDDGDLAADKRAMDQAQALRAARTVYAIDAAGGHANDLQLDP